MKKITKILTAAMVMMIASSVFADEKGLEIMTKVADFKKPAYSHTMVNIVLTDKAGKTETWGVEEYGKDENDLASVVMLFRTGSKKGTRFLQVENNGKPDDKFIYLPSLKAARRVNSSEGSKSFLGTDATYDDLTTRNVDQDEHTYMGDESKNGFDCYKIKEEPKESGAQYASRMTWIDKKTMYPIYTEMYDKNGKLVKTLTVDSIEPKDGYDIPMSTTLTDTTTGHSTTMAIQQIVIDKPLPARVFTQAFLETGK